MSLTPQGASKQTGVLRAPFLLCILPMMMSALAIAHACRDQGDAYRELRERMVRTQIATPRYSDAPAVRDPRVLQAMRSVPRHLFVPPGQVDSAYEDRPLPIGYGQTISQPYMVAIMTELVQPKQEHRALEIGTGSGYQAAVLAEVVGEVLTIEIVEPLGEEARQRLRRLGYKNVEVRIGDGYAGWPDKAPFDVILVTAGAPRIPEPLIAQLKPGGRMVIPVGPQWQSQTLQLVRKDASGRVHVEDVMPVRFVPFVRKDA